jgi:DNA-binding NarL/FixJ family response regulator
MDEDKKVLIVDDEPILAMDLKCLVEDIGCRVSGMSLTGRNAIKMAGETKPDVVLMDIGLNGDLDGIDTARIIIKDFEIPIIFITGNTNQAMMDRINEVNPLGFISKPINIEVLNSILMNFFNKS